ncbi:protease modulator HflC [Flexistipes sp.]|uniref:protease modulator HflC n=1 Tax=Flexistipes sp. TaxID=3088135 RepID=UPI002E21757C|nr:protease modulator HflC [Flexistipes sp.]
MKKIISIAGVLLILAVMLIGGAFYIVNVDQQVVVTYLGKPVKNIKKPGLYVKIPFLQQATYFSKKILDYDADPRIVITEDKKNLLLDNYCKWRIADPLKFFQAVRTTNGAMSRLDDIIYSEIRVELGNHTLSEVIADNRAEIMKNVTKASKKKAEVYGIEIVDVRIKRADLPPENEKAVFARMVSERERIAKRYRSEGREEAKKLRAKADKEKRIILAEAYRKVQNIKGETDSKTIEIYADAYSANESFYAFNKKLEIFDSLSENNKYFLTTQSDIFELLEKGVK